MHLAAAARGQPVTITRVGGERTFRRRLMELGLVPGTRVELIGVAPLGDPVELLVRGCSLSIRRSEASSIEVLAVETAPSERRADATEADGELAGAPSVP